MKIKREKWDFPGGPVVKNLPANEGQRFDPWSGETSLTQRGNQACMPQLLRPHPTTAEARLPGAPALQEEKHHDEKP